MGSNPIRGISLNTSMNSNERKATLLGESHGKANHRLRKMLLFKYAKLAGHLDCHQCKKPIENIDDFSIEHTISWQTADDPVSVFFNLDDIAFSHLGCNVAAANRDHFVAEQVRKRNQTHCLKGHEFTSTNTSRGYKGRNCKMCCRDKMRRRRLTNPKYGRKDIHGVVGDSQAPRQTFNLDHAGAAPVYATKFSAEVVSNKNVPASTGKIGQ